MNQWYPIKKYGGGMILVIVFTVSATPHPPISARGQLSVTHVEKGD